MTDSAHIFIIASKRLNRLTTSIIFTESGKCILRTIQKSSQARSLQITINVSKSDWT